MRWYITESVYDGTCVIIMSAQSLNGIMGKGFGSPFSSIKNPLPAKLIQGSHSGDSATRTVLGLALLRYF